MDSSTTAINRDPHGFRIFAGIVLAVSVLVGGGLILTATGMANLTPPEEPAAPRAEPRNTASS